MSRSKSKDDIRTLIWQGQQRLEEARLKRQADIEALEKEIALEKQTLEYFVDIHGRIEEQQKRFDNLLPALEKELATYPDEKMMSDLAYGIISTGLLHATSSPAILGIEFCQRHFKELAIHIERHTVGLPRRELEKLIEKRGDILRRFGLISAAAGE